MGGSHDQLLSDHQDRTSADLSPFVTCLMTRVADRGDLRATQTRKPTNAFPDQDSCGACRCTAGSSVKRTRERPALRSLSAVRREMAAAVQIVVSFLTIEQCRATVSGIGGFCVPNQFYDPGPAGRTRSSRHH